MSGNINNLFFRNKKKKKSLFNNCKICKCKFIKCRYYKYGRY